MTLRSPRLSLLSTRQLLRLLLLSKKKNWPFFCNFKIKIMQGQSADNGLPGKGVFMTLVCGYPSFVFPVTVYDLLGGTGGGRSWNREVVESLFRNLCLFFLYEKLFFLFLKWYIFPIRAHVAICAIRYRELKITTSIAMLKKKTCFSLQCFLENLRPGEWKYERKYKLIQ